MTQSRSGPGIRAAVRSHTLIYAAVGAVAIAVWWSNVYHIDLVYAMKGYSPMEWAYKMQHPTALARDFPSGAENYSLSAFMHVYTAASSLGISPEALLPVILALDIGLFAWAMFVLSRVLLPNAPTAVAALVVVLAIATPVRVMNLAEFTRPYYDGKVYYVADALRIFGIVMVLRGRPLRAAALLAGSFLTHGTMGMMGLACAAAMALARPRQLLKPRYLGAAALFLVIAGVWLGLQYRSITVSGGHIPTQEWIALTRAFSYHWYPVDNGLLTTRPQQVFLPFFWFLLMLAYYWPRRDRNEVTDRALAGVLAMLGLSIVGLVISAVVPVPFLIKLAFARSSDLVIIIGLVYVTAGLWRDLHADQWWRRPVAATVLVSLSLPRPEFPYLWSLLLASPAWLSALRRRPVFTADRIVAVLAATGIALWVIYLLTGVADFKWVHFLGRRPTMLALGAFLALGAVFARWGGKRFLPGLAVAAVVALALVELTYSAQHKVDAALARDYLEAQVWAREHTPRNALFMPEPTFYYGWRDFSQRSSFGNLREWLHTSWIYDSNFDRYQEGLRRFNEFGIDLQPYLHLKPPIAAMTRLTSTVQQRYYNASDEWRLGLAQRYGIDYFVLRRRRIVTPSQLPVVFQNDRYVIHAATR